MSSFTKRYEMVSSPRKEPRNNDAASVVPFNILCGRKRDAVHSTGTQRFRKTVSRWVPNYVGAPSKFEKSMVVEEVVEAIRADGGRFLQMQNQRDGTVAIAELSQKQIRTKVSHSLRDMAAGQAKKRIRRQKGEASKTSCATRKMSVESKNVVSRVAVLGHRPNHRPSLRQKNIFIPQEQLSSALCCQKMDELGLGRCESNQTIGTFTEKDVRTAEMTRVEYYTNEELRSSLRSEDISVASFDSASEKEEEDWWIDALLDDYSSSGSSDGVVQQQTAAATRPTTTAPTIYRLQLLRQPSIGLLRREDFEDDEANDILSTLHAEGRPPLAEAIFSSFK